MKNMDLTPLEQHILRRSSDLAITRRRRTAVVVTGIGATILLGAVAWLVRSWQFVLVISLAYIACTVFEKIAYANAILAYKSLIQKLTKQVEELEREKGRQRPLGEPASDSTSGG